MHYAFHKILFKCTPLIDYNIDPGQMPAPVGEGIGTAFDRLPELVVLKAILLHLWMHLL